MEGGKTAEHMASGTAGVTGTGEYPGSASVGEVMGLKECLPRSPLCSGEV